MKRIHITVYGRVQGVCFRMYAREEAVRLGLRGWVRNSADGSVEITAEGNDVDLCCLADWCRDGSPYSRVTNVSYELMESADEFESFVIK